MKLKLTQQGSSTIELMAGAAAILISVAAFISLYLYSLSLTKNIQLTSTTSKLVGTILENVRNSSQNMQVNFDYTTAAGDFLNVNQLPMAWDDGLITTAASCPGCPGRYGYTIQPYEQQRGLYIVTVRLTHTKWKTENPSYRDYTFVTSGK